MPANYVLLEKIVVGTVGASSVTFSNIPQTGYTDLVLRVSARSSTNSTYDDIQAKFNGVSLSYTNKHISGPGNGITVGAGSNIYTTSAYIGAIPGLTATSSTFGNAEIYIPNYTSANFKPFSCDVADERNVSTGVFSVLNANLWSNTAAITTIQLLAGGGDFVQYSTFSLYGVAKLGTTPAIAPKATGGDTIMTDGTYWYHAFLSSGTFTPTKALSCDVLVLAGGAGGGGANNGQGIGGGGGSGGAFYATLQSLTSGTSYTTTIGAGGSGSARDDAKGANGSNTTFSNLTAAIGGGGGGSFSVGTKNASNGGSGGGGATYSGGGTAGTSTQTGTSGTGYGFSGGTGNEGGVAAGGGGGIGAVGVSPSTTAGGTGGAGLNTWSSWLSATGLGVNGYIGGGGGGAARNSGAQSNGGAGGGGKGTYLGVGTGQDATVNTGSGGGGGSNNGTANQANSGGNGGSGLVIIRYTV